jgi:hypothetical protein
MVAHNEDGETEGKGVRIDRGGGYYLTHLSQSTGTTSLQGWTNRRLLIDTEARSSILGRSKAFNIQGIGGNVQSEESRAGSFDV